MSLMGGYDFYSLVYFVPVLESIVACLRSRRDLVARNGGAFSGENLEKSRPKFRFAASTFRYAQHHFIFFSVSVFFKSGIRKQQQIA